MKVIRFVSGAAAALAIGAFGVQLGAQQQTLVPIPKAGVKPAYDDGNVEAVPVRDNIHLVAGSGANIVVQTDPDGLLVIDTSVPEMADKVLAAIKTISPQPIRFVINTSADEQRVKGNELITKAGRNIYGGVGGGIGREPERPQSAPITAHEKTMHRLAGLLPGSTARSDIMWPQNTFFGDRKNMVWGGDVIDIIHKPNAHTDGDVIVWFRKKDVIAAGGILTTVTYPVIDRAKGGSIQGYLDAVNDILDIMVPEINNQGGTLVVPGNGRICNEGDVAEIRDTMTIIRDRIADMAGKGMTLAQVKAAKPTLDYDGVYGDPNAFIEAVYADVAPRPTPARR